MSNDLSASWRIFIEYYPLFRKLEAELAQAPWFADGWTFYTGHFNEGIFLQLYKPGWHNDRMRGIHLETWVSIDGVRNGSVPLVMHCERELPERDRFNTIFRTKAWKLMESWPGYHLSHTNRMEIFIKRFPLSKRTLVRTLTEEFGRVSAVGTIIDESLKCKG
jgi:hypothetical protein